MAKKLQLSELKVKSFVPIVDAEEQRTTKGGFIIVNRTSRIMVDLGGSSFWTETKIPRFSSFTPLDSAGRGLKGRR